MLVSLGAFMPSAHLQAGKHGADARAPEWRAALGGVTGWKPESPELEVPAAQSIQRGGWMPFPTPGKTAEALPWPNSEHDLPPHTASASSRKSQVALNVNQKFFCPAGLLAFFRPHWLLRGNFPQVKGWPVFSDFHFFFFFFNFKQGKGVCQSLTSGTKWDQPL